MRPNRTVTGRRWPAAVLAAALLAAVLSASGPVSAQADERPAAVTGVAAHPGDSPGELAVSWDAHPDGPRDKYRVAVAPVGGNYLGGEFGGKLGGPTSNTFAHGTSATIEGLTPGSEYKVIVRARFRGAKNSEWSQEATGFAGGGAQRSVYESAKQNDQSDSDPFVDVDAGWGHVCGLRESGLVYCWGVINNNLRTPVSWPDEDEENLYKHVTAGRYGTCAVNTDSVADCFDFGSRSKDIAKLPKSGVESISADSGPVCWLLEGGRVRCHHGRLPDKIKNEQFQSVHSGGDGWGCGLTTSNLVECWQVDQYREAPDGEFKSIGFGGDVGCGIKMDDDTLVCWTWQNSRLLDHYGMRTKDDYSWVELESPTGTFTHVETSYHVACAVRTNSKAECWSPWGVNVPGGANFTPPDDEFTKVSVDHWYFACGLKTDGAIACWGAYETAYIEGIYSPDRSRWCNWTCRTGVIR